MIIEGSKCPKCNSPVEYNGNYYCTRQECAWALDDLGYLMEIEEQIRQTKKQFVVLYTALMHQLGKEPDQDVIERYQDEALIHCARDR